MENVNASGMIPLFLSRSIDSGKDSGNALDKIVPLPEKRCVLVACAGAGHVLSETVKTMAHGFDRKNAMTTVCKIVDRSDPLRDLAGYDGVFIGIAPDRTGSTKKAFSFIRSHLDDLAAMPVALFFLLSHAPKLGVQDPVFKGLSRMHPLDVQSFDRSSACLGAEVTDWAENKIWPLMETGWLADLIFPEPVLADARSEPVLSIA
ncbi:MAG: hypothetical protein HUK40_11975 [Desulfobacter sp.]|nr:hypothetical protein [Desulfobacter sp.]WDP84017.1 MAG: hypothetical protein HUN05_01615 [Desulfobacter sp.]